MKIHQPSIVFKTKDVKLISLNDFTSSYDLCPGFGMNIPLTFCQALGTLIAYF
jgi:hypothetical protein